MVRYVTVRSMAENGNTSPQVRVSLDPDLIEWVTTKAARQYRSVSSVVREAVAVMRDAEEGMES